ncbi:MAG: 50S ribosomal protein L29 [Nitrospinaceae bacterium]|jgi:large subunit ribosomal protein L29|nr:50S ribosomal protein L29 [Nitrospinaceae bacterium]|tara:strand:+ start:915 stop:1151 length:237 start_codon:yes stop_codon:yes gene_type:complete
MKVEEIRGLSEKEREEKIVDFSQEIFNLRFQLATGKIENPSRLRGLRRDIARLKTVQRENRTSDKSSLKQENKASSDK